MQLLSCASARSRLLPLLLTILLASCSAETISALNGKAAQEGTYWVPNNGMGGKGGNN
jgi:hypothetical protein